MPMVYPHNPLNICRSLREWHKSLILTVFFPMSFSPEAKLPQPQEGTAISLEVQSDLLGLMPHVWLGLNISPKASPSLLGVVN